MKASELQELTYLQGRISEDRLNNILKHHLPQLVRTRVKTGRQVQTNLRAKSRGRVPMDVYLKVWRRATLAIRQRIFKSSPKYRLESGGAMIAIVGTHAHVIDGSKSKTDLLTELKALIWSEL